MVLIFSHCLCISLPRGVVWCRISYGFSTRVNTLIILFTSLIRPLSAKENALMRTDMGVSKMAWPASFIVAGSMSGYVLENSFRNGGMYQSLMQPTAAIHWSCCVIWYMIADAGMFFLLETRGL